MTDGRHVDQAQFAHSKTMLAVPSHLLVLAMPGNDFHKDKCHSPPRD